VNVNFASPEVLMAMLPGLTLEDARRLVNQVKTSPFKNAAEFALALPPVVPRDSTVGVSASSQYFMVTGYATQGDGASAAHALLKRDGIWAKQVRKSLQ
jgi:general secretion pathway protein K